MVENDLAVPGSHVMHYRKKCHLNPYCNTGVTIIKLITCTSTTYTVKTKLKTALGFQLYRKLLCLLLLNISVVVVLLGIHWIKCSLWYSVKSSMKTLHFSLCCKFCVLLQSSDFCLALCTHSVLWLPLSLQVLWRHRAHCKIRPQKRHWSLWIVFVVFCSMKLLMRSFYE